MQNELKNVYRKRVDFSKIENTFPIPDILTIQKQFYRKFLQMELLPEERKNIGLQAAFKDIFPVSDFKETTQLDFISYSLGNWECNCGRLKGVENSRRRCNSCSTLLPPDNELVDKEICPYCNTVKNIELPKCEHCGGRVKLKIKFSSEECLQKGYIYSVPIRIKVRLISWEKDPETKAKRLKHIKEQKVYFGDIPLMTEKGTFIFNGIERVIVSQLQRSPGVFFRPGKTRGFYIGKIIPYRGAWVEFEYDKRNNLYVRLDRKKKLLATIFLRALGFGSDEEILKLFYQAFKIYPQKGNLFWEVTENLIGKKAGVDIVDPGSKKVIVSARKKITHEVLRKLKESKIKKVILSPKEIEGAHSLATVDDVVKVNKPKIKLKRSFTILWKKILPVILIRH